MKSEPTEFSMEDLAVSGTTYWSGVRNFQARNWMRDTMRVGDGVLFYHSNVPPIGIAGEAEVVRTGYPDHTAWDPKDRHFDPKSSPHAPLWFMVDLRYVRRCRQIISLAQLKSTPQLAQMIVVQRGVRLSVQPVKLAEWKIIMAFPEWV